MKNRNYRLFLLLTSFTVIIILGRIMTKSFLFIINDYWFVSGILLVILLSLIDQPFFSSEGNVFVNAVTAWMSLILLPSIERTLTWKIFFGIISYLVVMSYIMMWVRKNPIAKEPRIIKMLHLLHSKIARPEVLFSVLFIWGLIRKFSINSIETNSFLLFWGIFIILNIPDIAGKITNKNYFKSIFKNEIGFLTGVVSPSIILVSLRNDENFNIGDLFDLYDKNEILATGILIDDRIVTGKRLGKISIIKKETSFHKIASKSIKMIYIKKSNTDIPYFSNEPVSIVDRGTELSKVCFYLNPLMSMAEGEIVWMPILDDDKGFYQVISANLIYESEDPNNQIFSIKVIAGQLGIWNQENCRFEPINWVPKAGETIYKCSQDSIEKATLSNDVIHVGNVPNSPFPVHINIEDTVTHNTAIIGVTGSGKSYLSFRIIEELAKSKIKIMILDLSRQHWIYLEKNNNITALKKAEDIQKWYKNQKSFIGIYQFADETSSYPKATSKFVEEAFKQVSDVKLKAGVNEPAKLCIVFEEAHSLVPEWNQVSQRDDPNYVNKTSRFLLQGRKFGMGCLLITQRTANVTKTILNQCNSIFALQSFDQTGLDFLSNYMGSEYSNTICTLPKQHCILVGKSSSSARPILFKILDLESKYVK